MIINEFILSYYPQLKDQAPARQSTARALSISAALSARDHDRRSLAEERP